jgi:hypothetical protein
METTGTGLRVRRDRSLARSAWCGDGSVEWRQVALDEDQPVPFADPISPEVRNFERVTTPDEFNRSKLEGQRGSPPVRAR